MQRLMVRSNFLAFYYLPIILIHPLIKTQSLLSIENTSKLIMMLISKMKSIFKIKYRYTDTYNKFLCERIQSLAHNLPGSFALSEELAASSRRFYENTESCIAFLLRQMSPTQKRYLLEVLWTVRLKLNRLLIVAYQYGYIHQIYVHKILFF